MTCYDIIFPISLGPLTYRCPEHLEGSILPGMLVSAPLKKSLAKGIIYRINTTPPSGPLRDITEVQGSSPLFSPALLKLIGWISEYHLAPEGLVLKQLFPKEIFKKTRANRTADSFRSETLDMADIPRHELAEIESIMTYGNYRTTLLHAPSILHEYSAVEAMLRSRNNVLVIFPEIAQTEHFYNALKVEYGERICMLHSDLSAGRRSETIDNILSGKHDIVIGTRAALFVPATRLTGIIVMNEHSSSYKLEEGIRINIRDTAVMRAFFEKVPVVLMTTSPSLDSWFNSQTGKYNLVRYRPAASLPQIRIADMRFRKRQAPYLSSSAVEKTEKSLQKNGRVLYIINRRGHSTFLTCSDCGNTESCKDCGISLVLHKDKNLLVCHYCARSLPVPDVCSKCRSPHIEQRGAGTQKIEEFLKDRFNTEPIRFDSDSAGRKTDIKRLLHSIATCEPRMIVGTKMLSRRLPPKGIFSLAVILNIDSSLNIPDFRAREKTYQEIASIRDLMSSDGEIIVQTRFPQDPLFKYLRDNDFDSFAAEELAVRAAMKFPPYSRLMNVYVYAKPGMAEEIIKVINSESGSAEILGPTEKKSGKGTEYSFLLKHPERKVLQHAAREVMKMYKNSKDIEIRIDMDPY